MHSENAQLLSLKGKANANGLYGTPDFDELGLEELTELVDAVLPAIKYGKIYQGNSTFFASHNSLLGALLDISDQIENKDTPKDIKQIASDLILVFQNISKNTGSFVSGHPGISVGYEIHKLFSHTSLIDSEFKHKVYLKNPQLFDDQSMSWTFVNGSQSAPKLNEEQIVALSKEALEIVEDLSHVVQLSEARELMSEYKTMAKMFLKFSEKKIHKDLEVYTLNSESLTNLEEILEIDFQ